MKNRSPDKLILGQLNINSIRNKFDSLRNTIHRNIDVLLISETKLSEPFLLTHFKIHGFSHHGSVLGLDLIEIAKEVSF